MDKIIIQAKGKGNVKNITSVSGALTKGKIKHAIAVNRKTIIIEESTLSEVQSAIRKDSGMNITAIDKLIIKIT